MDVNKKKIDPVTLLPICLKAKKNAFVYLRIGSMTNVDYKIGEPHQPVKPSRRWIQSKYTCFLTGKLLLAHPIHPYSLIRTLSQSWTSQCTRRADRPQVTGKQLHIFPSHMAFRVFFFRGKTPAGAAAATSFSRIIIITTCECGPSKALFLSLLYYYRSPRPKWPPRPRPRSDTRADGGKMGGPSGAPWRAD